MTLDKEPEDKDVFMWSGTRYIDRVYVMQITTVDSKLLEHIVSNVFSNHMLQVLVFFLTFSVTLQTADVESHLTGICTYLRKTLQTKLVIFPWLVPDESVNMVLQFFENQVKINRNLQILLEFEMG